ncbi:MAG: hypothetical protein AAGB93_16230 [Planctomycetota bacterium]
MISRQIGSLFRGKATPFQIVTACVLGCLIGFAPGITTAPALYLFLTLALLVVNANFGVALFAAGLGRVLAWQLAPYSFEVGLYLLDGPTAEIADRLVGAPVLAWCALDRYVVTGGLVVGTGVGVVIGGFVASLVARFRRRMAAAAANESKWTEVMARRSTRFGVWLLFGKNAKGTWSEKAARRTRTPLRPIGVLAAVGLVAGIWFGHRALTEQFARESTISRLAALHGATVDLTAVRFDLGAGEFGLEEIAFADPDELDRDAFRAREILFDFGQLDLLRRRANIERIVIDGARSGVERVVPGELFVPEDEHDEAGSEEEPVEGDGASEPGDDGTWTLDEILEDADLWKARLARIDVWLDRLSRDETQPQTMPCGTPETDDRRVQRKVREAGWASAVSPRFGRRAPSLHVGELVLDDLTSERFPHTTFDVRGSHLSTAPSLIDAPPTLSVAAKDHSIGLRVDLAPVSRGGGEGGLRFFWMDIEVDRALALLSLEGKAPLRGGTLDLEFDGVWANGTIGALDVPVRLTFHDTTLTLPSMDSAILDELIVPAHLTGTLAAPVIHFDTTAFTDQLIAEGLAEVERRAREEAEELLNGAATEAADALEEAVGIEIPVTDSPDEVDEILRKSANDALRGALGRFGGGR